MENKDMEGSGPTESYSANRYWPPFVWGGRVDRWLYISRILSVFIQSVGSHEREIINIGKHRSISVFNRYLIHYLDTKFEVESFDLKLYRHEEIRKKTSRKLFYIGVVACL